MNKNIGRSIRYLFKLRESLAWDDVPIWNLWARFFFVLNIFHFGEYLWCIQETSLDELDVLDHLEFIILIIKRYHACFCNYGAISVDQGFKLWRHGSTLLRVHCLSKLNQIKSWFCKNILNLIKLYQFV